MSQRKDEIIRYVNDLIAQKKNKTYRSPLLADFAEIYIEDDKTGENEAAAAQKAPIPLPPEDEKRRLFFEMRRLYGNIGYPGTPYDRLQAILFYKQAKFMESFEDDYEGSSDFSMYFPSYQAMSYEQLRTYFSWRSKVRGGIVGQTSFSYAFVYIYELINNIGITDCRDGLNRLIFIWQEYRKYEKKLDQYMRPWIKDYYITNTFSFSFDQLLQDNPQLKSLYRSSPSESFFDFYYPYSDYKIKKSIFYSKETKSMIVGCFNHVVKTITGFLDEAGVDFTDLIFYDGKGNTWQPFRKALYYSPPALNGKRKTVRISDTEIYRCNEGCWSSSRNRVVKENGRLIIGYILRRIEQFYRKATKFKYKLNASPTKIHSAELAPLITDLGGFFARIDSAILEYYRNSNRKIITVDTSNLEKIRANAQIIQEKLLVDTDISAEMSAEDSGEEAPLFAAWDERTFGTEDALMQPCRGSEDADLEDSHPQVEKTESAIPKDKPLMRAPDSAEDAWVRLAHSLTPAEKAALRMILQDASMNELSEFCRRSGMMPEVLVDTINEKAIDTVNDTILELSDDITVFNEYTNDLKRVIFLESE